MSEPTTENAVSSPSDEEQGPRNRPFWDARRTLAVWGLGVVVAGLVLLFAYGAAQVNRRFVGAPLPAPEALVNPTPALPPEDAPRGLGGLTVTPTPQFLPPETQPSAPPLPSVLGELEPWWSRMGPSKWFVTVMLLLSLGTAPFMAYWVLRFGGQQGYMVVGSLGGLILFIVIAAGGPLLFESLTGAPLIALAAVALVASFAGMVAGLGAGWFVLRLRPKPRSDQAGPRWWIAVPAVLIGIAAAGWALLRSAGSRRSSG